MAGSILETFFILFQSDADEVKDGADEAGEATDKLEKKIKNTDTAAKKAGGSFNSLAKRAIGALLPFVGLAGLKNSALSFAANSLAADDLSRSLSISTESLQAWQGAAESVGGDASGLAASMKKLNDTFYTARKIGPDKMLLNLADRFQRLSRVQAIRYGEKLGLDEGTITLLQKGRKGVEELLARQKELGLYTKRDADVSRKFMNALTNLGQVFRSLAAVAMRVLLPIFSNISEGLTTAALNVRKHQNLITGFFIALSVIMGVLAIKTGVAFAPFFALGFAILALAGAFAILYDDVVNFMEGNDSLIGRLSKDYPALADMVLDVVSALSMLWDIAKAVGKLLVESIESPTQAWQNFTATVGPLIDSFTERFPLLGKAIQDIGTIFLWLFDLAWPILKGLGKLVWDILGTVLDTIAKIGGLLGKLLGWAAGKIRGEISVNTDGTTPGGGNGGIVLPGELPPDLATNIAASRSALAQTNTPLASTTGSAAAGPREVNKTNTVHVDKVEVHTQATDAVGMAAGAAGALANELSAAADQFDDGVMA